MAEEITLTQVEDGYARVVLGRRSIGTVSREKFGSTRTGTKWYAKSSWHGIVGSADTRSKAIELLVQDYQERHA